MEDPRLDASVLLAELPIYKQEAQALIWLSYSVLGVRRDFDLRVESRRGRSYGTPRVTGREGLPELRIPRPQSEKPVRQKYFLVRIRRTWCVIGALTERRNGCSQVPHWKVCQLGGHSTFQQPTAWLIATIAALA